ncbi:Uu.00g111810.m01.CDS01 [Anthostomella pinea]|uniref:Uu.00g111810.m01.CDS01 n=1 Tax=Anthostomella pinea TaxID=933095 RepID=A0AAI8VF22_9PEZI|nr:Uu.00g111810.m01.CDS01 [Anthostomella pinea]
MPPLPVALASLVVVLDIEVFLDRHPAPLDVGPRGSPIPDGRDAAQGRATVAQGARGEVRGRVRSEAFEANRAMQVMIPRRR